MQLTIRAKLSKVIFPSDTYQVAVFKTVEGYDKSSFIACGNFPKLTNKEEILLKGEFKDKGRFGNQLQVDSWKRPIPDTKEQLITFFSSSLFKGVGKKLAEKIVDSLGNKAIQQISKSGANCLTKAVPSLKQEMAQNIAETVQRTFVLNDIIEKYAKYGISSEVLLKAHVIMGQRITDLNNNPYLLVQYHLIHFTTADEIAKQMGLLPHAYVRLETAIKLGLTEFIIKQGHCYLEEREFINKCLYILNRNLHSENDEVSVYSFINALEFTKESYTHNGRVYPSRLYYAEKDVANAIHHLAQSDDKYDYSKVEAVISHFESEKQFALAGQQKKAIHELVKNNVLILTGGPGTGKTFTVNAILNVYMKLFPNNQVTLTAPTGRAAKKLGEVTGMGSHALTIHRLLGIGCMGNEMPLFDEAIPLPFQLIVADEFSMADVQLTAHLFKAIQKGAKLLLVGDPDQLPSPGAGNVLKDLLDAGIPHVRLNQIFRQATESTIIKNAHKINNGEMIDLTNRPDNYFLESDSVQRTANLVVQSVERFISKGYGLDDILVLSPMKKGHVGVENLNELIRNRINPSSPQKKEITYQLQTYRIGDKVMYIRNNRDIDAYNGDTGIIKSINSDKGQIKVSIDGVVVTFVKEEWKYLKLAYVNTIHKAQGGSAKVVISVLVDEHDLMLTRNLFYTAKTRAEKINVIVGTKAAVETAIRTNRIKDRKTSLREMLLDLRKYIKGDFYIKEEGA